MIQNYNQDLLSENLTFIQLPCKILFVVTRKSITLVMIKGREEVTVCTQKASHVISTQTLNWNSSFAVKWSGRDKTYFPNFSNFTISFTLKKKNKNKKTLVSLVYKNKHRIAFNNSDAIPDNCRYHRQSGRDRHRLSSL